MISVCKPKEVPVGLKNPSATNKKIQLMKDGNSHEADSGTYAHDSVKTALNALYKNKCAYCERLIEEQADRRVDHFRPKKAMQTGEQHPGYYWLTYEWSNLVLSCDTCNRAKSNQFPVIGSRVTRPPSLAADWLPDSTCMRGEQPLLVNPEVDNPVDHFVFFPDGTIKTKNESPRGDKTIKVCKLDRPSLNISRKKLIDVFRKFINKQALILFFKLDQGLDPSSQDFKDALFKTILADVQAAKSSSHPFSRVGWHINQDPEGFLLGEVPAGIVHETLLRYFQP